MAIKASDIAAQITRELQRYTNEVKEKITVAQTEVAKETVKELKSAGGFKELTGEYRKGWRVSKDKTGLIIHNTTDYQLTHLLEKGHVNRDGTSRSRTFEHIRPAEQQAIDEYVKRVEKAIES